jgi:hypothetical protein
MTASSDGTTSTPNAWDSPRFARLTEVRGIGPWTVHMLNAVNRKKKYESKGGFVD